MKKKILGMILTATLIVSSSVSMVYAKPDTDKQKGNPDKNIPVEDRVDDVDATEELSEEVTASDEIDSRIDELKEEFKKVHKNKDERKKLIREIVELRKQNNNNDIPVFVNGKELKSDVAPVIKYGRTLIPVRAVTNALGANVEWDESTATATITKTVYGSVYGATYDETNGTSLIKIELKLDAKVAIVNGTEIELDVPSETTNNRMLVPIRFIAETFKSVVEWDEESSSVIIEDEDDDEDADDVDADDDDDTEADT